MIEDDDDDGKLLNGQCKSMSILLMTNANIITHHPELIKNHENQRENIKWAGLNIMVNHQLLMIKS